MIEIKMIGLETAQRAIREAVDKMKPKAFVTVGIHSDAGDHPNSGLNMATLGATHEFGASINHPGGTPYGFKYLADVERNKIRFLKKGQGYLVLGETEPHQITIPPRPFLVPGVARSKAKIAAAVREGLAAKQGMDAILGRIGTVAAAGVQEYMTILRSPPNAPSTVRKKKSSNPLIDTGELRQSITWKIEPGQPSEGL